MESGHVRLQRLAEVSQAAAGPTQDHPYGNAAHDF
jgi:hypothetical protein